MLHYCPDTCLTYFYPITSWNNISPSYHFLLLNFLLSGFPLIFLVVKYSLAEVWWGHFTEFTAPSSSPENFLVCLLGDRRPWRKYTSGIKSPYTVFNFSSFPTHWKKLYHQSILLKTSLLLLSDKSKSYTVFWKATSWKIRNSPKYHHSSVTSYIFHWEFLFSSPHLTFLSPWRRSKVSSHVDGLWTWPL